MTLLGLGVCSLLYRFCLIETSPTWGKQRLHWLHGEARVHPDQQYHCGWQLIARYHHWQSEDVWWIWDGKRFLLSTRYGYGTYQNTGVYSFLSSILISTKYIITQLAAMVKIQMWCFLPKGKCHWQGDRWVLASEARWTRQSHKSTWKKVASGGLRCMWAVGFHGIFIQQWITGVSRIPRFESVLRDVVAWWVFVELS